MDELKAILSDWPDADIQKDIAIRVATHAQARRREFSVDPATILILINCIISVIRLLYVCKNSNGVAKSIGKPGRIEKFLLHRQVKKNFTKDQVEPVYKAMLDVCGQLSQKEINELLDSVKETK